MLPPANYYFLHQELCCFVCLKPVKKLHSCIFKFSTLIPTASISKQPHIMCTSQLRIQNIVGLCYYYGPGVSKHFAGNIIQSWRINIHKHLDFHSCFSFSLFTLWIHNHKVKKNMNMEEFFFNLFNIRQNFSCRSQ